MADFTINPQEPLSTPNDQIVVPQPAPKPSGPVAGLRALYPELSDLNDEQLLKGVHKTDFADLDEPTFLRGLSKTYGPVEQPKNFLEQLHDHIMGTGAAPNLRAPGALAVPAGILSGAAQFGKGLADAAANEDTPERKFVTDTLTSIPKSLWGDLNATATTMRSVYRLLPPDIQQMLPKGTVPSDQELAKSNVRTVATLVSLLAGPRAGDLLKEAGAGLIKTAAAEGATYGGTYEAVTAAMQGKDIPTIGRQTLGGTIAGTIAGPVLAKGADAVASKIAEASSSIPLWFGKDTAAPVEVKADAPGVARRGTPPSPVATEPNPVELPPNQPTYLPMPGQQETMPGGGVPVTFQPVESPAGQFPGLGAQPNTLPGQVPGLTGNAAQAPPAAAGLPGATPGLELPASPVAPEITPADLTSPLEQPRPPAPPLQVQPNAVPPTPAAPAPTMGGTTEGPLPAGPPPGFQPNAIPPTNTPLDRLPDLRATEPNPRLGPTAPATPAPPTPPGRWRQYVEFADQNISDAKARIMARQQAKGLTGGHLHDLLTGEQGFADPANVRDAGIIAANYILRGMSSTAELGEALVRDLGEAARPHIQRLIDEGQSLYAARRPAGHDGIRTIASHYMEEFGAAPVSIPTKFERLDPAWGRKVADAYEAMPSAEKSATSSYAAFRDEIARQYKHAVDSGIKFVFSPTDKYNGNSAAMLKDLRDSNTLTVLKTPDDFNHPFLSNEENDQFRAIHDLFGHARDGYTFGPDGEYNAWKSHANMFSNKAIPAMSTETIGQTSWVNFNKNVKKGAPLSALPYAEQKGSLLPSWVYQPAIDAREAGNVRVSLGKGFVKAGGREQKLVPVAKALTKRIVPVTTERGQVARAQADITEGLPDYQKANPQAAEWYHTDVQQFEKNVQREFPDTKDPDRMGIYKLALAVMSPSRNPVMNVDAASRLWDVFNKNGSFPIIGRLGQEMGINARPALTKINNFLREQGSPAQVIDHLTSKDASGDYHAVNEFGPKVGRFWLNLMGIHDEVTVDVWMTRWWNRVIGTPLDKNGELLDAPRNDKEGDLIRRTVADLAQQQNMAPDAMQAVIWDREKKLWRDAGARDSGNIAFADASSIVFRNRMSAREKTAGLLNLAKQPELGAAEAPKAAPQEDLQAMLEKGRINPLQYQGSEGATFRMMQYARKERMIAKPDAVKGDAFWVAPDGQIIEVGKSLHSMVAEHMLNAGGIKAPKGVIGMNNAQNQLLQNLGFIRAQTQYGHLAVEFARQASDRQKRTLAGFLKEYPFRGGQAVSADGKMGETAGTWAEFLRLSDTLD
jgi:hypothetical protein